MQESKNSTKKPPIEKEGYLFKQGHFVKNWKKRYFVLHGPVLSYYENKSAAHEVDSENSNEETEELGALVISQGSVSVAKPGEIKDKTNVFKIYSVVDDKEMICHASSIQEMNDWVNVLTEGTHADLF